jgi:DNA replication and repair protein RecF
LIHADIERRGRATTVDMEFRPGRGTRTLVNKTAVQTSKIVAELLVAVFFGPDELSLVKGSPDGRRRFLDELVVKLRPARTTLKRDFERALKQRNALLRSWPKRGPVPPTMNESLSVWDETFARAAAALAAARLDGLAAMTPYARTRYAEIAGGGTIGLEYVSSWLPAAADPAGGAPWATEDLYRYLRERLEMMRQRELERGASLVGPQRDDVAVKLRTPSAASDALLDARTHASQGDQRTAALALKLAEHDLLRSELDEPPILLLDDVFSELDPDRRGWLREAVRSAGQTFISSAEVVDWRALDAERVVEVSSGKAQILG